MTTNHDSQTGSGARAGGIELGLDIHASSIVLARLSTACPHIHSILKVIAVA
jgi:hypothetical protein